MTHYEFMSLLSLIKMTEEDGDVDRKRISWDLVLRDRGNSGAASDERAKIVELNNGDSLTIECSVDQSYSPSSFIFLHNERNTAPDASQLITEPSRRVLKIPKFNERKHKGEYLCAASSSHGMVERTLVVKKRSIIDDKHYAIKCKENKCRNGGQCLVPLSGDRTSFCLCPDDYAGKDCESHAVSSYAIQGTKATFGLGGVWTTLLIVSCILLAILYRREKRKRREAEAKFDELSPLYKSEEGNEKFLPDMDQIDSSLMLGALHKYAYTQNERTDPPLIAPFDLLFLARVESGVELDVTSSTDNNASKHNGEPRIDHQPTRARLNGTSDSL
ncbi:unnamed protein product [Anisakis simplex]|uniref:EGF-like domain-containing protein n=1 Tax=Anisakis simplex TaxID=6269 RepID=A0A0M3JZM3_ANISI|nr:unnamed protein product [Anisakis simplex]